MNNQNNQGRGAKEDPNFYQNMSKSLETASIAAKYLDDSKNAKEAIGLAYKKEETKQLEAKENFV